MQTMQNQEQSVNTSPRIEQFKSEITDMKLKTGTAGRDTILLVIGIVLMVAGIIVAMATYASSLNQTDSRDLQSSTILTIAMLAVTVLGAAIFLRYSIAKFLRLWLLRNLYEGQANTDRIVEALTRR